MTPNQIISIIFFGMALACYLLIGPNAGHFFMFLIVLGAIEEATQVILDAIKDLKQ